MDLVRACHIRVGQGVLQSRQRFLAVQGDECPPVIDVPVADEIGQRGADIGRILHREAKYSQGAGGRLLADQQAEMGTSADLGAGCE